MSGTPADLAPTPELTPGSGDVTDVDSREAVREATEIAVEAAREAEVAAQEAARTAEDGASAPVEEAATAAARDVTAASELLADLVREFAADVPGQRLSEEAPSLWTGSGDSWLKDGRRFAASRNCRAAWPACRTRLRKLRMTGIEAVRISKMSTRSRSYGSTCAAAHKGWPTDSVLRLQRQASRRRMDAAAEIPLPLHDCLNILND